LPTLLEQPGSQHPGLELCLQTRWRQNTFLYMHRSSTKPKGSFHWNLFGQCGRYQAILYGRFIFYLLKDNMKKNIRVLTT